MIALDTNVLVRFLVGDDPNQLVTVQALLRTLSSNNPALICREVLVELVWVLERTYGFEKHQIAHAIHQLFDSTEIVIEDADRIRGTLETYRTSAADFSDLMIRSVTARLGATHVETFDKKFSSLTGVNLLS